MKTSLAPRKPKFSIGETVKVIDNRLNEPLTGKVFYIELDNGRILYRLDIPHRFRIVVEEKHLKKVS